MLKKLLSLVLCLCLLISLSIPVEAKSTHVKSYYRKDGTYVSGYTRNSGGSSKYSYTPTTSLYGTQRRSTVNLYRGESFEGTADKNSLVYISGYYRKDGTYVRPHYKTHANNYVKDNFSYNGISTLKPLDYYKSYKYAKNKLQENYLLYNSLYFNKTLNNDQMNSLKSYASKLSTKTDYIQEGTTWYQSIGLDSYSSQLMANFDKTGYLSSTAYVYFMVYDHLQINYKDFSSLNKDIQEVIPYYGAVLDLYSEQKVSKEFVELFGKWFYSLIIEYPDAVKQVEMDLLQKFNEVNLTPEYNSLSNLKNNIENNSSFNNLYYSSEIKQLFSIGQVQSNEWYFVGKLCEKNYNSSTLKPRKEFIAYDIFYLEGSLIGGTPSEKITLQFTHNSPNGDVSDSYDYCVGQGYKCSQLILPYLYDAQSNVGDITVFIKETGQYLADYSYTIIDKIER